MATTFKMKPMLKHMNGNKEAASNMDLIQCFPAQASAHLIKLTGLSNQ
jgi:hypothetical protein